MMVSLDILQIAEENFLITFGIVFGIGSLQGAILARGIRRKFPKLKKYMEFNVDLPQDMKNLLDLIVKY